MNTADLLWFVDLFRWVSLMKLLSRVFQLCFLGRTPWIAAKLKLKKYLIIQDSLVVSLISFIDDFNFRTLSFYLFQKCSWIEPRAKNPVHGYTKKKQNITINRISSTRGIFIIVVRWFDLQSFEVQVELRPQLLLILKDCINKYTEKLIIYSAKEKLPNKHFLRLFFYFELNLRFAYAKCKFYFIFDVLIDELIQSFFMFLDLRIFYFDDMFRLRIILFYLIILFI